MLRLSMAEVEPYGCFIVRCLCDGRGNWGGGKEVVVVVVVVVGDLVV